jgi:uncharacterized membrane protein YbaN (DUF454 family)
MHGKFLYVLAAFCLLLLGLVGLVLPIIPGLLFLFLAAWLMTKVSRRFAALLDDNPHLARHHGFLQRTRGLSGLQRAKLAAWVMAKTVVKGLQAVPALWKRFRIP